MKTKHLKKWLAAQLLLCAVVLNPLAQTKPADPARPIVLTHVNVLDMTGAPVKGDMTVVITGDRITSIQKSAKADIPESARVFDASGKYLIPGLWDMHVHWYDERFLSLFIANGVTGIRQMAGDRTLLEMRQKADRGELLAPRQFIAGPIVDGLNAFWPGSIKVGSDEDGRRAVRETKEQGYDFVKVYSYLPRDGYFAIADEAKKQNITFAGHVPDRITVGEASDAGQKSIEHLTNVSLSASSIEAELRRDMADIRIRQKTMAPAEAWSAWRQFYQRVLVTFDPKTADVLYARLAKNQTWQCPTLTVLRSQGWLDDQAFTNDPRLRYMPHSVKASWDPAKDFRFTMATAEDWKLAKNNYRRAFEMIGPMRHAGVQFLAGTDALNPFCFPGFSLHDELGLLVAAGLTPMEALQAATRNAAVFMGKSDVLGTLERGKLADLVLLDANPLQDIANTRRIAAVVVGGRIFQRPQLDGMLTEAERLGRIKSIGATLSQIIGKESVESAVGQYHRLKAQDAAAFDFGEDELNTLGYQLVTAKKLREAIEIFKLNVEAYPQSSTAYDSLAQTYLLNGDKELAIQNYKRSLQLNPQNSDAAQILKKLEPK